MKIFENVGHFPRRAGLAARIRLPRGLIGLAKVACAAGLLAAGGSLRAQTAVFWDTNGSTNGSSGGTTAAGTWDQNTTSNWSTISAGNITTSTWQTATSGSGIATFSAGSNATGAYTVTVSGPITGVRGLVFEEGTVTVSGDALTLGASSTINTNANNATVSSAITDGTNNFALTKTGTGTLTLAGANTYHGTTTVSGGTLAISADNNLGTAPASATAGSLTLNGGTLDATAGFTLNSNRGISLGSSGGTLRVDAGTLSYGGIAAGNGLLTKTGVGSLLLSGSNTFSGGVALSAGTLVIGSANAIGTGTLTIAAGTTLDSSSALTLTHNNAEKWNGNFTFAGSSNLNLGTGAVTLNASRTVTVSANTLTVGGVIDDGGSTFGLTKNGTGTLVLTGANSYDGGTTINGGTLQLGNGGSTGSLSTSGNIVIGSSGTLAIAHSDSSDITISNSISGAGNIAKTANDTLTLSGNNSNFSGALTAGGNGTVSLSGNNARGTGNWTFSNNSVLEVDATGTNSNNGVIRGGNTTFTGNASVLAQNSYAISGGNQSFSDAAVFTASAASVITGGNQTFTSSTNPLGATTFTVAAFTAQDDDTVGDELKNTARLTVDKVSSNNTITGGNQTFGGYSSLQANHSAAISGGTQAFNDNSNLRASKTNAVAGGNQTFNDNSFLWAKTTDDGAAVSGGNQTFNSNSSLVADTANAVIGGNQTFNGSSALLARVTDAITGGKQSFTASSSLVASVAGAVNGGNQTFTGNSSLSAAIAGAIGGGNQTFSDNSTLMASANSSITGGTQAFSGNSSLTVTANNSIAGGVQTFQGNSTIYANAANALSNITVTLQDDSVLKAGVANALSTSTEVYFSGANNGDGGILTLNGHATTVGEISSGKGGGNPNPGQIQNGNATNAATLSVGANNQSSEFSGVIEDGALGSQALPLSLAKQGTGALTLSGANTYTGNTTIDTGGSLVVGSALALSGSTLDYETTGGTLAFGLGVNSARFGGLTGNKNLTLQYSNDGFLPVALNVGSNNQSTTYSGVLSEPDSAQGASLIKSGGGTLTLAGVNTYSGSTTIVGGTLRLGVNNALSSSTDVNLTYGGTTLDLNGFEETVGSVAGIANTTIVTTGGLATNDGNSTTFSGSLTGFGSFSKGGGGTLTLNGTNTYNGGTFISGGTLALGPAGSLSPGGDVTVNSGATFSVGNNQTTRVLGGTGTVAIGDGQTLTVNLPGSGIGSVGNFGGSLTGTSAATFAEAGAGINTLSGDSHTFAGNIIVSSGTLNVANATALGATSAGTTVVGSGTLFLSNVAVGAEPVTLSGNGSFVGALVGTGTASLAGPLTLAANSTIGATASTDMLTLSGAIGESGGSHSLTKTGAGTVTLTGQSTYTGGTSVSQGTLVIGTTNALPTSTQLSLASSSTLDVANNQTIGGFLSSVAGSTILLEATKTLAVAMPTANTFTTFAGNLNGPATGTGTFAVSGAGGDFVYLPGTIGNTVVTSDPANSGVTLVTGSTPISLTGLSGPLGFSGNGTFPNAITGTGSVVISGGTTFLTGANTYSGSTTINGGILVAGNAAALGTGSVTISAGTLGLNTGITVNNPITLNGGILNSTGGAFGGAISFGANGGTLAGSGAFTNTVTIGSSVVLSPGNSPGALAFASGLTLGPGGTYLIQVQDPGGAAGVGYDTINVTGTLAFTSTTASKFTFSLQSLDANGNAGNVAAFNSSQSYNWTIATATSITGFTSTVPSIFALNTAGFTNSTGVGVFTLGLNGAGNALILNFSPVPEPSTVALLGLGLLFGVGRALHRRRASK